MKVRKFLLISGIIMAVLLIAGAVAAWLCQSAYKNAASSFPEDRQLLMYQQQDGSVQITWPCSEDADYYLLELADPLTQQVLYSKQVNTNTDTVKAFPQDAARMIRISTIKEYRLPIGTEPRQRLGEDVITVQDVFSVPEIGEVVWTPDPDASRVTARLTLEENCTARLYQVTEEEDPVLLQSIENREITLNFGQDTPLPANDSPIVYCLDVYRQGQGYTYYGTISHSHTVTRQDLLGTNLMLQVQTEADGRHTLSWNETKGEYYVLQTRENENQAWQDVICVTLDGVRSYTSPCPKPYTSGEYRVVALNEGTEEPVAQSETVSVETASVVTYATVWPISDLTVYSDAQKGDSIGTAPKGTAFCVLGLEEDVFRIRYKEQYGYIDSNHCLINLPDFIGDLCAYNITNSYDSLYKVHKYDIPNVTGKVITGYERIRVSSNSYLVPLLYPTAKKLEKAALNAREQGYTILIYDAFRPQSATKFLYDTAVKFSAKNVPDEDVPEDWTETTEDGEPKPYTYALYMTNKGQYALNNFLAKGTSRHNLGVAIDMTLVKNGEELEMQTAMHDLSWFSASGRNNSNAKILSQIMKGVGFGGLTSEWWHFQDLDTVNQIKPAALWSGVTPECWVYDGIGWSYRCADGSYYTDRTVTIDGTKYTFDATGYLISSEETGA